MNNELQEAAVFSGDDEQADYSLPYGDVSIRLFCSPNRGSNTEDALAIVPFGKDGIVLAVADGVGGSPGGREAANLVLSSLVASLEAATEEEPQQAILAAIEFANSKLMELGRGSGTTVAIAEISNGFMRSYHVGDSEIAVVGQRGKIKHRVVPHSPTGFAVESGLLSEDQAMHHDYRHVLLNVIGAAAMRVEVAAPLKLDARDTVILASDGLLDNLYPGEIFEVARCGPLPNVSDELVAQSKQRMASPDGRLPSKPDDFSLVLFRLKPPRGRKHKA